MLGPEQSTLPKLPNVILLTTLLSYHHSFLHEETEVLQDEAMCPGYKASDRSLSLSRFCWTLKNSALSLCKTASDDENTSFTFYLHHKPCQ